MTSFSERARELMAQQGVSLRELARRAHYDKAHVSRVLNGHKPPTPALAARLDAALDAGGALSALADERLGRATEHPEQVDTEALDGLAGMLAAARRLEDATCATTVLPVVGEYLNLAKRFAQQARSGVRAAAVGLAAELHQYAGWLQVSLKRWQQAEQHLNRAVLLGLEANDPLRTANGLSFAAYAALRRGNLSRAGALSEAAGRDSRVDPGLRTYVTYQRAEILAHNRDKATARRLLGAAESMVEQLPNPTELPASGYWYIPAFFRGCHAFALGALGEHATAKRIMAESLDELPPELRNAEWTERRRTFIS